MKFKKISVMFGLSLATAFAYADQPLILAVDEYPPYFSESRPNNGSLMPLVQKAFAQGGLTTKVTFLPWNRALNMAKGGVVVSPGWTETEERKKDFLFSEPFFTASDAVFSLKSSPVSIASVSGLKGKRVGIITGYTYGKAFDDARAQNLFHIEEAMTGTLIIRMLLFRRIDVIILNRAVATELLKTFPDDERQLIYSSPSDLNQKKWSVMVGRVTPNAEKVIASFNAGLSVLRKDGTLAKVTKELNGELDNK